MQHDPHNLHFLLHSANLVEERLRIQLAPLGIGPRQARILNSLHRMGTSSQVELAQEFDVTAASMSTMTARLIAAGLISRETDPNELRSNILSLTKDGKAKLQEIRAAWREVDKIIERALGSDRAEALAELTRKLRDALGGRVPGSGHARKKKSETKR